MSILVQTEIYFNVNDEAAENANYQKLSESNSVCYSKTPDYHSIMLYSENDKMTLKKRINFKISLYVKTIPFVSYYLFTLHNNEYFHNSGQRITLSDGDINALNNLYPPVVILQSRMQVLDKDIERVKERINNLPVNNNTEEHIRLKKELQQP